MLLSKIMKGLKNPRLIINYTLGTRIARIIPDKTFVKIKYKEVIGKNLNLDNPQLFNEKIQWLKIYDRKAEYTQLADKYEVRKYIKETIGEKYLIPLLGVYDSFEEIDFDKLPNQFVLKPNHTSGDVYICKDKTKIDYPTLEKLANKWLKTQYYWTHREWQYKNIRPRLICEKYMEDESGAELMDYKFLCFNSEVKCCSVCLNRNNKHGMNIDFYDKKWEPMPIETKYHPNSGKIIPRPKEYKKMVEFGEKLSKNMLFVRIDLYEINKQLYFGEITLHPGSGFEVIEPESYDYLLGSWINLPSDKKIQLFRVNAH